MIKVILLGIAALLFFVLVTYIVLSIKSQKTPDHLGLENKVLRPCPDTPNCVCSEAHTKTDTHHFIQPIQGNFKIWQQLRAEVIRLGGIIQTEKENYLHITFITPVFRYVDDVELRFDDENKVIHLRSASRIGSTDFGVNRKRIEVIKQAL